MAMTNLNAMDLQYMAVLMRKPSIQVCLLYSLSNSYSRCILWLKVSKTNNDPKVIAWYYLKCVEKFEGIIVWLLPHS
jgi:hypothetical protein